MREFVPILDKSGDFPIIVTIGSILGSIEELGDSTGAHYKVSKVKILIIDVFDFFC